MRHRTRPVPVSPPRSEKAPGGTTYKMATKKLESPIWFQGDAKKFWRGRVSFRDHPRDVISRSFSGANARSCRAVLLVRPTRNDLQGILRQRSLQRLRLIPRRPHPNVALLIRRQDHRRRLGWIGATIALGAVVRSQTRDVAREWAPILYRDRR